MGKSGSASSHRILVVEEEPMISQLIKTALGQQGHTVEVRADGQDGLRQYYEGDYTLLIVNFLLPRKSGLEIIRELRAQNEKVPIILMSSHAYEEAFGPDEGVRLLQKPFGIDQLREAVSLAKSAS